MIAALISASVSLLIFAIGRWLEVRAKQTDVLRGKLEEYIVAIDVILPACAIPKGADQSNHSQHPILFAEKAGELARTLLRPQMLCDLYFPDSSVRFYRVVDDVTLLVGHIHNFVKSEKIEDLVKFQKVVVAMSDEIRELRIYLINEQGYLTRRLAYTIFA